MLCTHLSLSLASGMTARFVAKSFMQQKLHIGLVPNPLVIGELPGGSNVFACQPDGYRLKFLLAFYSSEYVLYGKPVVFTHGRTQLRFDLRPVFFPPSGFFFLISRGRNGKFFSSHDYDIPLSVK